VDSYVKEHQLVRALCS